jgi:ketosteroid isomerase-like protein
MSRDTSLIVSAKLELVRSLYGDWERGDFRSAEWADPDIEFVIADGPSVGSWTGLAGMVEGWRDVLSAWDHFQAQVDEYRELDDERVLVLVHFSGRGKTSGLEASQWTTTKGGVNLFHVRGGKVTKLVIYFDRERALADLGLPSEAGSPRS